MHPYVLTYLVTRTHSRTHQHTHEYARTHTEDISDMKEVDFDGWHRLTGQMDGEVNNETCPRDVGGHLKVCWHFIIL